MGWSGDSYADWSPEGSPGEPARFGYAPWRQTALVHGVWYVRTEIGRQYDFGEALMRPPHHHEIDQAKRRPSPIFMANSERDLA